MYMSVHGLQLLKQFEGCRLTAYWDVKGYSIGYGHFGVPAGMTITQEYADKLLIEDLRKYENAVDNLGLSLTQGQFDALVDFAYNCGIGNLKSLTNNGKRTLDIIRAKIPEYVRAGGVVDKGLVARRSAELRMFDSQQTLADTYYPKYDGTAKTLNAAFKELGIEDSSLEHRKRIAIVNMYNGKYTGTKEQNNWMLGLLKAGELRKCD